MQERASSAELDRDEPFGNRDLIVGGSAAVVLTRLDDAVAEDGVVGVGQDVVVRQGQKPVVAVRAAADGKAAEGSGRDPVVADGHAAGGGPDGGVVLSSGAHSMVKSNLPLMPVLLITGRP